MGAFLTGLIGRAEQQRDKEEAREFQEAKDERDRKRKLVEYAGTEALKRGDDKALPFILGELDELGPLPGTPKGMKDPYKQLGIKLGQMIGLKRKQAQQQQQAQRADQQYQQVTGQPPPGAAGPVQTTPMPPPSALVAAAQQAQPNLRQFDPAAMQAQAAQPNDGQPPQPQTAPRAPQQGVPSMRPPLQALVEQIQQGRQEAEAKAEAQGEKTFQIGRTHGDTESQDIRKRKLADIEAYTEYFKKQPGVTPAEARTLAEEAVGMKVTQGAHNMTQVLYKRPGSEELQSGWADPRDPGKVFDATSGQALESGSFTLVDKTLAGAEARSKYWGEFGNYYRAARGQGLDDAGARNAAGAMVYKKYGTQLGKQEQDIAINQALSGIGAGGGVPPAARPPAQPVTPSAGQPRNVTQPMPAPSRPVRQASPAGPLANLTPRESENVLYYLGTLTGTQKGNSRAAQVRSQEGLRTIARVTGLDPMTLTAKLTETPALAKQIGETVQRSGAIQRLANTIEVHGKVLNDVMKHQTDTGSPFLNKPLREWSREAQGSPDYKRLQVALNEMQREYAYLTAGGAQSRAMLPVHTSESMDKILSLDSTLPEIVAATDQIGIGAKTELGAMNKTVEDLQNKMLGGPAGQTTGANPNDPLGILK